MWRLLVVALLIVPQISNAQEVARRRPIWTAAGGGGVTIEDSCTNTDTDGGVSCTMTGVTSGSLLVCSCAAEPGSGVTMTVTSSPTLTWTNEQESSHPASSKAAIATATAGSTESHTMTCSSWEGWISVACYSTDGGIGASAMEEAQSVPSVAITTTAADSLLISVTADWNAVGASATYRTTPTVSEILTHYGASNYGAWHYRSDPAAGLSDATGYTLGMTAPTGQSASTIVLEVLAP